MNVLITGGAGYIGSNTSLMFLDKGHNVTIVDNLVTGYKELIPNKANFIKSDISNVKNFSNLFKEKKIDIVIHFAAHTKVSESLKFPQKYYENNYDKAKIFIDECIKQGIKKIIFSSSAAVYGNVNKKDIYENEKTNPTNPYSKTKLKLENYLRQLGEEKKVSCIILRYFNVSGADKKMRSGLMSNSENLIKAICEVATNKKETFVINGNDYNTKDGTPIRDFIHVSDLAEMHLISAEKIFKDNIVSTDIYNCGYGRGYSVKDVIKVINDLVTNKIQIEVGPRRKGDIEYSIANVSKFKKNFNWKPKFDDLKTILATALDWEKKI
ncbi:MAG: UDP-glucose 4-epimerase GalE [Candidatus Pelagibacter sp. TMED165]|nr:MAG: UDP-glucose 4-epimerase GalE [Candidatus Pelagibacter sp. TMED165]